MLARAVVSSYVVVIVVVVVVVDSVVVVVSSKKKFIFPKNFREMFSELKLFIFAKVSKCFNRQIWLGKKCFGTSLEIFGNKLISIKRFEI